MIAIIMFSDATDENQQSSLAVSERVRFAFRHLQIADSTVISRCFLHAAGRKLEVAI